MFMCSCDPLRTAIAFSANLFFCKIIPRKCQYVNGPFTLLHGCQTLHKINFNIIFRAILTASPYSSQFPGTGQESIGPSMGRIATRMHKILITKIIIIKHLASSIMEEGVPGGSFCCYSSGGLQPSCFCLK